MEEFFIKLGDGLVSKVQEVRGAHNTPESAAGGTRHDEREIARLLNSRKPLWAEWAPQS